MSSSDMGLLSEVNCIRIVEQNTNLRSMSDLLSSSSYLNTDAALPE